MFEIYNIIIGREIFPFLSNLIGGLGAGILATVCYNNFQKLIERRKFEKHFAKLFLGSNEFNVFYRDDINGTAVRTLNINLNSKLKLITYNSVDGDCYSGVLRFDLDLNMGYGKYLHHSKKTKTGGSTPFGFTEIFYDRERNHFYVMDHYAKTFKKAKKDHNTSVYHSYIWKPKKD